MIDTRKEAAMSHRHERRVTTLLHRAEMRRYRREAGRTLLTYLVDAAGRTDERLRREGHIRADIATSMCRYLSILWDS